MRDLITKTRALDPRPLLVASLFLFAVTVEDVHRELGFLQPALVWLALSVTATLLVLRRWAEAHLARRIATVLLAGTLGALVIRIVEHESVVARSEDAWYRLQRATGEKLARRTASSFENLCRDARVAARDIARSPAIAVTAEGPDQEVHTSRAFDALKRAALPRAHPRGIPGVTLYDAFWRPLAWSGETVFLGMASERPSGVPEPELFVFEEGVYTYLIAVEPLPNRMSFVSVEIPLIADRRLENRFFPDYDSLSSWAGRRIDATFFFRRGAGSAGDSHTLQDEMFWERTEDGPRLSFALKDDEGRTLGRASLSSETPPMARLEARRRYALAAGLLLVLTAAFVAVLSLIRAHAVALVLALWGARFVARVTELPLGLGLELDNPAHYASSIFFGLARSPADFFFTTGALLASVLYLMRLTRRSRPRPFRWVSSIAGSALATAILVGTNEVVLDAWLNSSFVLSRLSFPPSDMPRLVLQLGLVLLFLGATSFVALVAHWTGAKSRRAFITDAVALLLAYLLSVRFGLQAHVVLSALPLFAARNVAIRWGGLAEVLSRPGALLRAATYAGLGIVAVTVFYPALAYFRETTIRDFVETTVRPVVLQHDSSRTDAVLQVAEAIDGMEARGELSELGRSDMAFEIWLETGLASSSLSSAVEILDSNAGMMSRFALSYPLAPSDEHRGPAPSEWLLVDETVESDPNHPGVLMARSVAGPDGRPWEIHVRLAADWKNLPFISTQNPYLNLFRTHGFETGSRFPYRELSLSVMELDGRPVFQSTEGLIPPPDDVLDRVREDALWWRFSRDGEGHDAHVFADGRHVYVLSYPQTAMLTYAAELASWMVLSASLAAALLLSWLGLGALESPLGVSARELWATIGTSFSGKLYVAFVLIALIPIALLAFLTRGLVIGQLQEDVEQEGTSRAHVVERLVRSFPRTAPAGSAELRANVTDALLDRVGALAGVDVDVYAEGELVATSKPELFGSGLLRTRAVPSAYREIVLERRIHWIHRESVGSFQYLVASVPIELQPNMEPGILSIPLASREAEITRRVSALDDALLLAALGFSIAALSLAYSLAKRIAGPVNALTEATHRVAGGDLDVSLQTESKDEIGTLFASFIQMTADLKRQRADLERSKKLEAWAEMARQVAHEVKNPLTPIQLSTEHLLRVYTDPEVDFESVLRECSDTILDQVKALRQISMEFSTFASPEPLKPEDTDVGELLRDTVEPYLTAPPGGVTVELDQAAELPRMRVDRRLLKRTLLNLIENGLHAVSDGGVIRIGAKATRADGAGFLELTVTDTGVGIEPEIADRIFEPYFSTRATGTGLGLAIAKKVVEDHGGTIALESGPGRGTRVTIRLPDGS